ncbi:hypothetical protein Vadar_014038 [Vaccinium darrowii]|uniref:Uncharacterized protein n=1 Tax=Vaccinium darrowii TaxID=229202 RepID=A0ACB7ZJ46_9ERIC|nr:hypothetical protein Vadar_014038 [Vaccinium darrowii]
MLKPSRLTSCVVIVFRSRSPRKLTNLAGIFCGVLLQIMEKSMLSIGIKLPNLEHLGGLGLRKSRHNNLIRCNGQIELETLQKKKSPSQLAFSKAVTTLLPWLAPDLPPHGEGLKLGKSFLIRAPAFDWVMANSTSVWLDNRTGNGPLRSQTQGPLNRDERDLKVSDCWANCAWHFRHISFEFPNSTLDSIHRTTIQWFNPTPDSTIWNHTSNGDFTHQSARSLLNNFNPSTLSTNWKWIWRLPCTYRIQLFVTLAAQDRLSTRHNLFLRHITTVPDCEWCPLVPENSCHALRDLNRAKEIWTALSFPLSNPQATFLDWIRTTQRTLIPLIRVSLATFCFFLLSGTFGMIETDTLFRLIPIRVCDHLIKLLRPS